MQPFGITTWDTFYTFENNYYKQDKRLLSLSCVLVCKKECCITKYVIKRCCRCFYLSTVSMLLLIFWGWHCNYYTYPRGLLCQNSLPFIKIGKRSTRQDGRRRQRARENGVKRSTFTREDTRVPRQDRGAGFAA